MQHIIIKKSLEKLILTQYYTENCIKINSTYNYNIKSHSYGITRYCKVISLKILTNVRNKTY